MKNYLFILVTFWGIGIHAQQSVLYKDEYQKAWVDSVYQTLTLEEKIGQLFIVAAYSNKNAAHENAIRSLVQNEKIGGLIFMQNDANKQVQLTNSYQAQAKVPLLIGIDAEWGLAMRLKDTHKFPYAMTLGAIQNDSLIYKMGQKIAQHCKEIGIHWNFAPVVDVNTNPKNPIIGNRSFGSDVQNVSDKGTAYALGMQSQYVLSSAKHFPGHGDTSSDSHKTLPVVDHPLTRLQSIELNPFQNLINNGVTGIMVAHLDVPSLEPDGIPSTLSKNIITDLLKEQMGFEGLVITDALNMQGVASQFPPGIVDVKAFEAGNDVLLFSQNVGKAKEEIHKKIQSGEITEDRLNQSVRKILMAKYFVGLNHYQPLSTEFKQSKLNDNESVSLTYQLFENATTLVKSNGSLPYTMGDKVHFLALGGSSSTFAEKISQLGNISTITSSTALQGEKVIIGVFKDTSTPYKSYKLSSSELNTIQKFAANNEVTVVLFTSPYALKTLDANNIENIVVAYENNIYTQNVVPELLFGKKSFKGKLPAEVSSSFPFGEGVSVKVPSYIFPRVIPESQGVSSAILNKIDDIAQAAISQRETPGMQIMVLKNGNVVYNKNFGYYDYYQYQAVTDSTLYDLASLTKVLSTLPLIMKMYDEKAINLDETIDNHFPYAINTDKAHIRFREILLHNSGLKSWIPFYKETLNELKQPDPEYYRTLISEQFQYPVTEALFSRFTVKDLVYRDIVNSALEPKTYDYSDLGFYILQYTLEKHYRQPLDVLFDKKIAQPLGLKYVGYRPLQEYKEQQIAPTEIDDYYRYQTIRGTVQDQGAALFGGVAGHAGLFGNAEEVAALMQMFLNQGYFREKRIVNSTTVQSFTTYQNGSRRGLGFDKQRGTQGPFFDNAPASGFGHTGYTGTMVWADPAEQLVFVFLSNRTYPDASVNRLNRNKTRQRMLKVAYEALL